MTQTFLRKIKKQVEYMVQHGTAEPSYSAWGSLCLLAKANDEDPFLHRSWSGGWVHPIQAKLEHIVAFPVPTTRTELCRFSAMVGYYRGFCKTFSTVTQPLTELLRSTFPRGRSV